MEVNRINLLNNFLNKIKIIFQTIKIQNKIIKINLVIEPLILALNNQIKHLIMDFSKINLFNKNQIIKINLTIETLVLNYKIKHLKMEVT